MMEMVLLIHYCQKRLFIITLAKNSLEAEQRKENGMMKITVIVLIMRIQSIISEN